MPEEDPIAELKRLDDQRYQEISAELRKLRMAAERHGREGHPEWERSMTKQWDAVLEALQPLIKNGTPAALAELVHTTQEAHKVGVATQIFEEHPDVGVAARVLIRTYLGWTLRFKGLALFCGTTLGAAVIWWVVNHWSQVSAAIHP